MKNILIILAIFCFTFSSAQKSLFSDESYRDVDFYNFKLKLAKALENKSIDELRPLLADSIIDSKDGCGICPKDIFLKNLFSDENGYGWKVMKNTFRFGFKNHKDYFQAPSFYQDVNMEKEIIVLAENVNVRKKPNLNSEVIAQLSFQKVKSKPMAVLLSKEEYKEYFANSDGYSWIKVTLENGKSGYIVQDFTNLRMIEKEITVKKNNDEWKITSFSNPPGC